MKKTHICNVQALRAGLLAAAVTLAAGCGGGGGSGSAPQPQPQPQPPVPPPERGRLVTPESSAAFADFIRAGLSQWAATPEDGAGNTAAANILVNQLRATPAIGLRLVDDAVSDAALALPANAEAAVDSDSSGSAGGSAGFTTTNTIVAGVDERDRVKYDGEHMFLMGWDSIQAFRMSADAAGEPVGEIAMPQADAFGSPGEMYLLPETHNASPLLVAVGGQSAFGWNDLMVDPWHWTESSRVALYDVADPAQMSNVDGFVLDGTLTHSRRIGDRLLLVTRHTPHFSGLEPHATDAEAQAANADLIANLDVDDLLPTLTSDGGAPERLVSPENCLLPVNLDVDDAVYLPTITTISWINLRDLSERESLCVAEGVQGAHVTTGAVYLSAFDWQERSSGFFDNTVVHKITLTEQGPAYSGSASVPGSFWGNPSLLMGEAGGALAVVTTTLTEIPDDPFRHILTTLGDGEDFELEQIGQIPSEAAPDLIGKPREQIFASRIAGDRAYIVTFEQVDPVYVIDLANPASPSILGELTIPGFSEYLHPLNENRVIGIGRNTDGEGGPFRLLGVNVRLFDVSDPADPTMLSDIGIGSRGSYTPASHDYQAFTLLQTGADSWRLALPVTTHGTAGAVTQDGFWWVSPWANTGLHLFDVSADGIEESGVVVSQDYTTGRRWQAGCCAWSQRSVLHNDTIHFVADHQLITSAWQDPDQRHVAGLRTEWPVPDGFSCPEEDVAGIEINVWDVQTGASVTCPTVSAHDGDYVESLSGESCDGQSWVSGVVSRPGTYTVEVSASGYAPRTLEDVNILASECGIAPVYVEAWLEPQAAPADG